MKYLILLLLVSCSFKSTVSKLDIKERKVDCGLILLFAVNRGDIHFTGSTKENKIKQYNNFINDCVKLTLTKEKIE